MKLTRREFGLAASAAWWSRQLAFAEPGSNRALILIQLAGGNDGLNCAPPLADARYAQLRPALSLKANETIDVGADVALHAALSPLVPRLQSGQLAIVQGIGYPKSSRSHFEAIEVWQSGELKSVSPPGWVTRGLEKRAPGPFTFVGLGNGGASPALRTEGRPPASLASLDAFAAQPDKRSPGDAPALLKALGAVYTEAGGADAASLIRKVGRAGLAASDELKRTATSTTTHQTYPRGPFGDQLKLAIQLLTAPLGVRVVHVTLGGFDTHANQKRQQQTLLESLAQGITAVLADAEEQGIAERLLLMTYSEFGRRVQENGSGGTDHGAGSVMFVAGAQVKGGFHGRAPDLGHLEQGDVPVSVDFREAYASVLKDWFQVPTPLDAVKTKDALKLIRTT